MKHPPSTAIILASLLIACAAPAARKPPTPAHNPTTRAKIHLGKFLFFDKRLSSERTVSCASCHDPKKGWTDQRPTPVGVRQRLGERNAISLLNAAHRESLFWDGRAATLEEQALSPLLNAREMDMPHEEAVARLAAIEGYAPLFKKAFGDSTLTIERVTAALASFQRTLITGNSPYDRHKAGKRSALSPQALRGMQIFNGKANCAACHYGPDLTDERFHNIGVGLERRIKDFGRFDKTADEAERGAFRTPPLRNLADTQPYMHDGSLATMAEVIDFFDKGGFPNSRLSPEIKPLGLSAQEKKDLLAFLESLNGEKVLVEAPRRLPR